MTKPSPNVTLISRRVAPGYFRRDFYVCGTSSTGNARKFTAQGEVGLHITGQQQRRRFEPRFAVRHTGIGLDSEQQQRIFAAFSQAYASITRRYGGSGLGLAIYSRLLGSIGGEISVYSIPNEGSTFHFTVCIGPWAATKPELTARPLTTTPAGPDHRAQCCSPQAIRSTKKSPSAC